MGKIWISGGGGAGSGSDDCTASKQEVLKGYSAITSDSDDETIQGTLELTADATDGQVLSGKTYYNTNPKSKRTGSMTNQGAVSVKLNAGEGFTVPSGFHNGGGKVEANSLASQTGGTAIPSHVLNGETFWVNGYKSTGLMSVQSILSFSCAPYSASQIIFTWQNPQKGPYSGVIIVGKTGGYPANINDGTRYYKGFGNNSNTLGVSNTIISGFGVNVAYYFRAFSYSVINGSEWISDTIRSANTIIQQVVQVITSSTVWTVPNNVYYIDIFCVGGGGGGGWGATSGNNKGGGGGGGGYTATVLAFQVAPGQKLSINIGAGGNVSTNGGDTYVTGIITALGGKAGISGKTSSFGGSGGDGGSGGGGGCFFYTGSGGSSPAGNGGLDGSNGEAGGTYSGVGQHTTTRAFGINTGTLYSGAGGGGGSGQNSNSERALGGSGGGGNGADVFRGGSAGTNNTGGGGGGGYVYTSSSDRSGFNGGSGVCIIKYTT